MKTFTLNLSYGRTYSGCTLCVSEYALGGTLAVTVNNREGGVCTATIKLDDSREGEDVAFLDTNNVPGIDIIFQKLGFVTEKLGEARSGYCVYPLYRFDMKKLAEYEKQERN